MQRRLVVLVVVVLLVSAVVARAGAGGAGLSASGGPAQLNRLSWYETSDWRRAYPGDKTILGPAQVPGADLPASWLG